MPLHAKQKGNLGELRVASDLIAQGYYVFKELGDICKADLVVMDGDYKPIKVQVKSREIKNGAVSVKSSKSGPNYRFSYEEKHADIYAIYVLEREILLYVHCKELLALDTLTIRIDESKNNQETGINPAANYLDFKRALRDYTRNT